MYERWVQWQSCTARQADNQLLSSELEKFLTAEPVSGGGMGEMGT